jgi:hypothetical protein
MIHFPSDTIRGMCVCVCVCVCTHDCVVSHVYPIHPSCTPFLPYRLPHRARIFIAILVSVVYTQSHTSYTPPTKKPPQSLVNRHSTGQLGFDVVQADRVRVLLLLILLTREGDNVRLEARAKVAHADNGIRDCGEDEEDGDDGKGRHGAADGAVKLPVARLVDADELEDKVREGDEVDEDDDAHAGLVLAAGEKGGEQEDGDCDGDGSNGEAEFRVDLVDDDDDELDREAEEEEKVELEQGNVDLIMEEALLHAVVGTNRLENVPCKFLVQLPGDEAHDDEADGDNDGDRNQEATNVAPDLVRLVVREQGVSIAEHRDGLADLVNLDGGKDHHGQVGDAEANDLDRVLHPEGVPRQHDLVQEAKDEEREKGGDDFVLRRRLVAVRYMVAHACGELGKDIGLSRNADNGLYGDGNHKEPRPHAAHEAKHARLGAQLCAGQGVVAVRRVVVVEVCKSGICPELRSARLEPESQGDLESGATPFEQRSLSRGRGCVGGVTGVVKSSRAQVDVVVVVIVVVVVVVTSDPARSIGVERLGGRWVPFGEMALVMAASCRR